MYFFKEDTTNSVIVGGSDPIIYGTNRKGEGELSWNLAVKMDNIGIKGHTPMDN